MVEHRVPIDQINHHQLHFLHHQPDGAIVPVTEMALEAWLKANGKTMANAPAYEEYVTDPATEKNAMKVLTRVGYPLGK